MGPTDTEQRKLGRPWRNDIQPPSTRRRLADVRTRAVRRYRGTVVSVDNERTTPHGRSTGSNTVRNYWTKAASAHAEHDRRAIGGVHEPDVHVWNGYEANVTRTRSEDWTRIVSAVRVRAAGLLVFCSA